MSATNERPRGADNQVVSRDRAGGELVNFVEGKIEDGTTFREMQDAVRRTGARMRKANRTSTSTRRIAHS